MRLSNSPQNSFQVRENPNNTSNLWTFGGIRTLGITQMRHLFRQPDRSA